MPIQIIVFAAFAAFAVFYGISMQRKRAAGMGPALKQFLEHTGYRYANIPEAPIDQQVAYGAGVLRDMGKGYKLHMVRDFRGLPVHNHQAGSATSDNGWCTSFSWSTPLSAPPRAVFQLADKSLAGLGKAVKEAFSNTKRTWKPVFATKVPLSDAELDGRFVCYGEDADAARRALATPGLKELVLACTEVDLVVSRDAITLSDPFQKNLKGTLSSDVSSMMRQQGPVHDRIAELLAAIARAVA